VYLHGAHITSWVSKFGENIFVSEKAVFAPGKAIRGGIPLCFPQFGNGKIQAHGFARNTLWEVAEVEVTKEEPAVVRLDLQLKDNKSTSDIWPHNFIAKLSIRLSTKLTVVFSVANTGKEEFDFQLALHTYYSVSDIQNISVTGLKDSVYIDKVKDGAKDKENRQAATFSEEVDRVYTDVKDNVDIFDKERERTLHLERNNLPDVVLWNPWIEKARNLGDLGEDAYPKFVCVEVGHIDKPVVLAPGQHWVATHTISEPSIPAAL